MSKHIKNALKIALIVWTGYKIGSLFVKSLAGQAWGAAKATFTATLVGGLTSKGIEAVNANFGTKATLRAPTAPRQVVYGQTRINGVAVHVETTGTDNYLLHQVIVLAGHEIESLEKVKFGDTDLVLSGQTLNGETVYNVTNSKYLNTANENKFDNTGTLVRVTFEDGSQTTANGYLVNQLASMTSDHKFRGCAYVYIQMVFDADKFAGGIPNISFEVKGKKVYDPRLNSGSGGTAWSDNPALCIRDYLSNTSYGLKATTTELNDTTNAGGFSSAANICDQTVADIDSASKSRYTANGFTNFSASGEGILEGLLSAMSGRMTYVNGKFNVFAGATQTPSLTITDDDLLSDITVATNPNSADLYNTVKPIYVDKSQNYVATDAPVFQSSTFLSADTPSGESSANYVKQLEIRMPFTTNVSEAQRIARIKLNEQRQTQTLDVLVSLKFMQLQPNDWVYLTNSRLSYSSKVFEVVSTQLEIINSDDIPVVATRLVLKETANSVYGFVSSDYETEIAEGSSVSTGTFTVSSPTGLSATSVVSVDITTTKINAQAQWTNATNNAILGTEVRYGTSSGTYIGSVLVGKGETKAIIPNLNSNTTYYVVARHFSANNIFSDYTSEATVATGASGSAPSVPTSLSATTGNPLNLKLSWTNPSNSDLRAVKIYRHTAAITPTDDTYLVNTVAVEPGTATSVLFGKQDGLSAGTTYYFYARSVNHTGLASSFTSGVSGNFTEVEVTDIDLPDFSGYFHKEGSTTTALSNSQFNTEYGRVPLSDDILIMVNTSASPKVSKAYKYSSGSFSEISNFTTGDLVVDGTLAGTKIVAASIAASRVDSSFISTLNLITTSATIGNDITIGSGTSIFKADSNGIYLGNATFSSAPFRVTPAGALTASAATISGSIKSGESITAGTGTRTVNLSGSSNADIIFSAGNATPTLAPFKIKSDGSIEITNLRLFKSDGTTKMFDSATGFTEDAFSEIATDLGTAISNYSATKTGSSASDAQKVTLTASQSITVSATKSANMSGFSNSGGSSGITAALADIPDKVTMVLKYSPNANLSSSTTLAYLGSSESNGVTKVITGTPTSNQYKAVTLSESEPGFEMTLANIETNSGAVSSSYGFTITDTDTYAAGDHYFFIEIGGTAGTSTTGANNVSDSAATRTISLSGTEFYIASDGDASDTGEGDITSVTAGTGLSGGGTSGAVTLTLTTPALPLTGGALTGDITVTDSGGLGIQTSGYSLLSSSNNARAASGSIRLGNGAASTGFVLDYTDQGQTVATIRNAYVASTSSELTLQSPFITFDTGTSYTEALKLDHNQDALFTGKVGIDYATPSSMHSAAYNLVVGSGASGVNTGLTIYTNSDATGSIHWADGTSGSEAYQGYIFYTHSTNNLVLGTAAGERIRISGTGAITFNQAYTFPTSIGSAGQTLKVPSSGTILEWATGGDAATLDGAAGSVYFKSPSNVSGWSQSNRNFSVRSGGDAVGLHLAESDGTFGLQLYANSGTYGFLDAEWASWDIQKTVNGIFQIDEGSGLNKVWSAGNDGAGSGLDADTLDGQHGSYYLSGNVLPTAGNYVWSASTAASGYTPVGIQTSFVRSADGWPEYGGVLHVGARGSTDAGGDFQIYCGHGAANGGNYLRFRNADNSASPTDAWTGWKTIWDSGNDGSGSGLDADTLDGIQGASFLRSDTADSFTGSITMGTQHALVANNYGRGVYGIYASTRHQHVWSMGTSYNLADDGQSVGNLYGISYTHTNVGSASASGLGHQLNGRANGTLQWALGDGIYSVVTGNVWGVNNDGSGSGLDADTLDGQQPSGMGAASKIAQYWSNGYLYVNNWIHPANGTGLFYDAGVHFYEVSNNMYCSTNYTSLGQGTLWGATNDGSGSGLDADTLDGIQGGDLLRSNANDSLTGTITMNNQAALVAGHHGRGVFGYYSSYVYQHIWSMGTAYKTSDDGSSYGNMYGMTYTHTNVGTGTNQSISGLSHQWQHRHNGSLTAAIGNGIWSAYNITAYSDIAVKRNLEVIPNALDKVCSINGYTYERTDYVKDEEDANASDVYRQAGVVAQEIEKVLPEVVSGEDGNKAVAYGNVVALLIEAIKELKSEVEDLKEQLEV